MLRKVTTEVHGWVSWLIPQLAHHRIVVNNS